MLPLTKQLVRRVMDDERAASMGADRPLFKREARMEPAHGGREAQARDQLSTLLQRRRAPLCVNALPAELQQTVGQFQLVAGCILPDARPIVRTLVHCR